jgi:tetratricopeptide (TPR) repeat protein
MDRSNQQMWDSISQGLPATPSPPDIIPLPEILRVMQHCLDNRVEKFDLALQLLDTVSHMRDDAEFLNWKAMVEFDAKSYVRSFETTERVLAHTRNHDTLFNAGRAAYKANRLEHSERYLREALALKPGDSSITLDHAVTVCTMGDFDRAIEIIESIDKSKLDETHAKIVDFNKGWHRIRQGA